MKPGFIEILTKEIGHFSMLYYGVNDYATSFEIKDLLAKKDILISYLRENKLESVDTIGDFALFLFCEKIIAYNDILDKLASEDNKEIIEEYISVAESCIKKVDTGSIVKFINKDYETIFSQEFCIYHFDDKAIEYIGKYINGVEESPIKWLCETRPYLVIYNFQMFQKTLEEKKQLFLFCFGDKSLNSIRKLGLSNVLNLFKRLKETKSKLINIVDEVFNKIYDEFCEEIDQCEDSTILLLNTEVQLIYKYLESIKDPRALQFKQYIEKANILLNEYLDKHGQKISFDIKVDDILPKIMGYEEWYKRVIYLTHSVVEDEGKRVLKSNIDIKRSEKNHFSDLFSSNNPSDDYFTNSFQRELNFTASYEATMFLNVLMQDDWFDDYTRAIYSEGLFLDECFTSLNSNIAAMINGYIQMVNTFIYLYKTNEEAASYLLYGLTMYLCALTEYMLRYFYLSIKNDRSYISDKYLTLGYVLNEKNKSITDVFGMTHTKNLGYFLFESGDKKIGENIRNRLAHLRDIIPEDVDVIFHSKVLWLFTDIINTIFIFVHDNKCKENKTKEEDGV